MKPAKISLLYTVVVSAILVTGTVPDALHGPRKREGGNDQPGQISCLHDDLFQPVTSTDACHVGGEIAG